MATDRALKQFYFLLFAPLALFTAYSTLYLERRGLSHGEIGLITAVAGLVGVAATLAWGHLTDRLEGKRRVTVWLAVGSALAFPALWFGHSFAALLAVMVLFQFFRSPLIPLADAYCLDVLQAGGDPGGSRYSQLRLWGSVGFIVASFGAPLLLPSEQHDALTRLAPVFCAYGVIGLAYAARAWRLPDPPLAARAEQPRKRDMLRIAALPGAGVFFCSMFLSTLANSGYYLYLSLYLEDIGVPDHFVGSYWGVAVIAEVALLAIGTPLLRRWGARRLILAGYAGRGVRLLAFSWPLHPLLVMLLQPLHALAFGASHLGSIAYLARTVPPAWRASGQAMLYACSYGLGGLLGNWLAGWVSDHSTAGELSWLTSRTGLYAAFWLMGWLQMATLAAAALLLREPPEERPAA